MTLLRIVGTDPPGRSCCGPQSNVHVGIQIRREPDQVVPADVDPATFTAEIDIVDKEGGLDLRGPCVQGRPDDRFVYLTWGEVDADGGFEMFRRAKLMFDAVDADILARAQGDGVLEARLGLTDEIGQPRCAAMRPPLVTWSVTDR